MIEYCDCNDPLPKEDYFGDIFCQKCLKWLNYRQRSKPDYDMERKRRIEGAIGQPSELIFGTTFEGEELI